MKNNLLHIYYGYGKGKTTAAVGLAYRCGNRGKKVLFTAFLKGRDSGEFFGCGPFETDDFSFSNKFWEELNEVEKEFAMADAKKRLMVILEKASEYDMIILDEFLDAIILGCIEKNFAVKFVLGIYRKTEVVITGHKEVEELFEIADYITEMKKVKHPFDKGIQGREGIEF